MNCFPFTIKQGQISIPSIATILVIKEHLTSIQMKKLMTYSVNINIINRNII